MSFNFMAVVTVHSDFGAQENKFGSGVDRVINPHGRFWTLCRGHNFENKGELLWSAHACGLEPKGR